MLPPFAAAQALPIGKAQLIDRRAGIADDRAAAHGVDQDVDSTEFLLYGGNGPLHLTRIEGVAEPPMRGAAGASQGSHGVVEAILMIVDANNSCAFVRHDL